MFIVNIKDTRAKSFNIESFDINRDDRVAYPADATLLTLMLTLSKFEE